MPPQDLKAVIFIIQFQCIEDNHYMIVRHCVQSRFINYSIYLVFVGQLQVPLTTLCNVCAVPWGVLSTVGVFSTVGDIMSTVGDIMSTVGGYLEYRGGVQYHGGIS